MTSSKYALEEQLIMEVESHRILYDKSNPDHKYKNKIQNVWKEISYVLGEDDVINNCLERIKNYDLILTDSEHKVVKEFIKILDVFGKATDVFQGSKYPTLNLTMIFHVEIKDKY
ncbi:hypothetical protein Bhyg_12416 [Pseudolycoriella hygida]|uniref:MADF domain-containing protein n=1 Tax=Pseudolycoriella hygida TaxID=35572 RepID=A0A9Q0MYU6_9DIPT|nr:hypothetical protein Bhyg_12416 [Pseudolycoriella hygida]